MKNLFFFLTVVLSALPTTVQAIDCCAAWDSCFTELDGRQKEYLQCLGEVNGYESARGYQRSTGLQWLVSYRYPFFVAPNSCQQITLCGLFEYSCREILLPEAEDHLAACKQYRSSIAVN